MYKTYTVPASEETTAAKEVKKLFKELDLQLWQVKNFSPVNDKESEYLADYPQYKVIVLLTADQVERLNKKPADQAKKAAVKKPADQAKKVAVKKPADQAKKVAVKKPAGQAKKSAVIENIKPGK